MHAAEHDRVRTGVRRLAGEPQRVAHHVRDVLDLGALVVVREDHGVALGGERANLVLHRPDVGDLEERRDSACLNRG